MATRALGLTREAGITFDEGSPFSNAVAHALRQGDPQALAHVYSVLVAPLTAYMRSQVRDPHLVNDLVQDTFVELVRGCRSLTGEPRQIRAWVFRAAHRNAIDQSRYIERHPERLFDALPDWESADQGPAEVTAANDEAEQVRSALRQLPVEQEQVLTLRFLADLSAPEVAAVMGKTVGAVRALQHRGVAALAQILCEDPVPKRAAASPKKGQDRNSR